MATIEGIRKMIEEDAEDACCVDLLNQTYAVERAIDKLEDTLLQGYFSLGVPQGFPEGWEDDVTASFVSRSHWRGAEEIDDGS